MGKTLRGQTVSVTAWKTARQSELAGREGLAEEGKFEQK